MKKIYFFVYCYSLLLFLFITLFSCIQEESMPGISGNDRLSASIIDETPKTRTVLADNPTNRVVDVTWRNGDAIGVFGSNGGVNILFQTNEAGISQDGKTTVFETTATPPEGELVAYHPYQQGATMGAGGILHLTMPATQSYITEKTGIVRPYSAANMMTGKGKDGNITFRNLFSILRVSIAGSDGQNVKQMIFTDLSGKPVSGNFSVAWNGDIPEALFPETGSGKDLGIVLDCGEGVPLSDNTLAKFYMIVPARGYNKGFRIEFILADGGKITKTIGVAGGKILQRNMLYPIGDLFPNQDDKVNYKLHENASVLSEERFDQIRSASLDPESYELTLTVEEGFSPRKDEMILINRSSPTFPNGYVGKVKTISGTTVVMEPVKEIIDIFEDLSIGDPIWGSNGSVNNEGGYAIDLTQYVTSIETADGKPVEFTLAGSTLLMEVPYTRAEAGVDTKFSMPALSHTFKIDDGSNANNSCGLKLGVQMDLALYFHILIQRWSLKDLQCRINPTINLSSEFNIEWVTDSDIFGTEIPFIVIRTAPIPAGPVMIIPLIEFFLTFDLEGKAGLTAQLSYSKEFSFGMSYENGTLSNYSQVDPKEATTSPFAFTPKVQLEGSFAAGIAPKVGFSLWEIIRLDTRVYTKVKSGANLNFDLSSPLFDPSVYNAFSSSKLFSQLELFMKGGVFGWKNREFATTESNTLEYPIWEAFFVPKLENFSIAADGSELEINLDLSNKLFFKAEVGMNIYEKDEKTGEFTVEAGTLKLCDYSKPPVGGNKFNLKMKERLSLPPGKEYEARLTVALDAPGGPYTLETDVKTRFTPQEASMTFTTSKPKGSTIGLGILSRYSGSGDERLKVWIDLNNNRIEDTGEEVVSDLSYVQYTIQSQTITIYGLVSSFNCNGNQLTSLDVSKNASLESLSCYDNLLTSLNLNTALQTLYCSGNQLTSLNVNSNTVLEALSCSENRLTSLDVNGATALTSLVCHKNSLTSINVSNLTALQFFRCEENLLTSLDVTNNPSLGELSCEKNKITALDVSKNTVLTRLTCYDNQLISLDISKNPKLTSVNCNNNQLTALVMNNPALRELSCANNKLVSFDLSHSTALTFLYCPRNNLTVLDISSNTALTYLYCAFNNLISLDASTNALLPSLNCSFNQLVSLKVCDYGVLGSVSCQSNRINGAEMTALVESLPDRTGMGFGSINFGIEDDDEEEGENEFIWKDRQIAEEKNWYLW